MNSFRLNFKLGNILYLIVVFVAAGLRFLWLGEFPLTDPEASAALQAAQATVHASAFYSDLNSVPQPSYEILTRLLFQLFGAEDSIARFVPAFAGTLLVLTPLLARKKIGFGHSLLMGFLLAVSPIFVTISRTASGISLSVLGLMAFLMAVIGWTEAKENSQLRIAGIGLGLALASGPTFFAAAFSFGIGLVLWKIARLLSKKEEGRISTFLEDLRPILWPMLIAVFSFATGLGWSIQGLSRFFESVAYWFDGWGGTSPYAALTLLVMIPIYMPMLSLLGIFGLWSAIWKRDRFGAFASIVASVGVVVALSYPSRQPHDLIWVVLPLVYIGSQYLLSFVQQLLDRRVTPWIIAVGAILIIFTSMAYLQISSIASQDQPVDLFMVWQTPFALLAVIFVVVSFFGLGWNWISAKVSILLTLLCIAFALSASALWRLNFTTQVYTAQELWRVDVPTQGLGLLMKTLETTSQSATGVDEGLNLEIVSEAPNSLLWALREYRPQSEGGGEGVEASPVVLVKATESDLILQADYVGQTLAISEKWGWDSALPPDFLRWWVKRKPPTIIEEWLILIRQDIAFAADS